MDDELMKGGGSMSIGPFAVAGAIAGGSSLA